MHLSIWYRRGWWGGRAWGGDLIVFVGPGVGRLTDPGALHLPYKPLESTISDEKLFIEIAFAEYFSRSLNNIQSEQSYDHTSHAESQKRDLKSLQTMAVASVKDLSDDSSDLLSGYKYPLRA